MSCSTSRSQRWAQLLAAGPRLCQRGCSAEDSTELRSTRLAFLASNSSRALCTSSVPQDCHMEAHADYEGFAITWGLHYYAASAAQCCQRCKEVRGAGAGATWQRCRGMPGPAQPAPHLRPARGCQGLRLAAGCSAACSGHRGMARSLQAYGNAPRPPAAAAPQVGPRDDGRRCNVWVSMPAGGKKLRRQHPACSASGSTAGRLPGAAQLPTADCGQQTVSS